MQFACASALAMLVEGHGEVCPLVLRHGGLASLATMLRTAGAQGKKAAAEALQACSSPSALFCGWLLCKQPVCAERCRNESLTYTYAGKTANSSTSLLHCSTGFYSFMSCIA